LRLEIMGKDRNLRAAHEALGDLEREIDRFLPVVGALKRSHHSESPSCRG